MLEANRAKLTRVYVVYGHTGEYSDHIRWPVLGFTSEKKAQQLVVNASEQARVIEAGRESKYSEPEGTNLFDPDMRMDYTGTHYSIDEIDVEIGD